MSKTRSNLSNSPSLFTRIQSRVFPTTLWNALGKKTKEILPSSGLILSFDCDTEEDIKVAWDVHSRLMDMGILAVYAVPGDLLKRGEKVYGRISETGAQFINHGGREHTYFDQELGRHASCFFYDQQPLDSLKEDILLGHKTLQTVLGVTPTGFRTPHFGTFQRKEHLSFLYGVLRDMNYLFSTSTVPLNGYRYGSIYKDFGIYEIPVTGIFTEPMNILDTWAYFRAPDRTKSPREYQEACEALARFAARKPILLNIYGDPSHVHNQEEFFEGIKHLAGVAKNTNYNQLLGTINGNIRSL